MVKVLEYIKDVLGLVGTILATIPYYRDLGRKRNIQEAQEAEQSGGVGDNARELFAAVGRHFLRQFFMPDTKDLFLITAGLLLLAASFLASLALTLLKD